VNVQLALLADYASVSMDGKMSVAGIFDRLVVHELPWHHPTMFIALRILFHPGEEGDHGIKIRFVNADGREIIGLAADVTVKAVDPVDGGTTQLVLSMNNVPIATAGRYAFDVFFDGRYEHTVPLVVERGELPEASSRGH
jgi:hypothetical protein